MKVMARDGRRVNCFTFDVGDLTFARYWIFRL